MKLTNYIRDAFIKAAMDDVPSIDYEEQMRSMILKDAVDHLPPKIKAIWKDHSLRGWIETYNKHFPGSIPNVEVPGNRDGCLYEPSEEFKTALKQVAALDEEQRKKRNKLECDLHAIAYSATTRKQLVERLPEFEKYLPAEESTERNLPAVANVVTAFVKAGWPKNKQLAAAAT